MPRLALRLLALTLALAIPARALALDLVVDETDDAVDAAIDGTCADAEGRCTLRAAVQEVNATTGPHTIALPAGKFVLKRAGAGEDDGATGDLDLIGEVTLTGAGAALTVVQGKKDHVFHVLAGANVLMEALTITKGKSGGKGISGNDASGGGIRNQGTLELRNAILTKNKSSDDAGAIANEAGTLTLVDVTLSANKAKDDAGAFDNDGGTVTLRGVTVSKNKAKSEAGGFESEQGGTVDGENVTVSGNKAGETGGANVEQGGSIVLVNATITGNKSKDGGAVTNEDGSFFEIASSLLAGNKGVNCDGLIESLGGNVEQGSSCGFGPPDDLGGVADAGLEKLADNGGPTQTHALAPGSPAIDAGNDVECPLLDQRGQARFDDPSVAGSVCDAGAFEHQGP